MTKARQFFADRSGATSIEYALIGALVSIVMVSSVTTIGSRLLGMFQRVANWN